MIKQKIYNVCFVYYLSVFLEPYASLLYHLFLVFVCVMDNLTYHSSRLKNVHAQALAEVESQIKHWQKVKKDYEDLSNLLTTLPDKPFHNVMIPMGPLAIMPGKLIHTNELLVHLGDSWFADVSCKQGLGIISVRLKRINKNLEDLDKVLKNLKKKTDFTTELDNFGEESKMEIKEELPSNYVHPGRRKRVSRVKSKTASSSVSTSKAEAAQAKHSCFDDETLMKRLDELEKLEETEDQLFLSESSSKAADFNSGTLCDDKSSSSKNVSLDKKVIEGSLADTDDSDDSTAPPGVIYFHHTSHKAENFAAADKSDRTEEILHPGHIGRRRLTSASDASDTNACVDSAAKQSPSSNQIQSKSKSSNQNPPKPKSILKHHTHVVGQSSVEPQSPFETAISKPTQVAVSDVVLERSADVNKVEETSVTRKRVSRFKASRQRQSER